MTQPHDKSQHTSSETVPCKTCGTPTPFTGSKQCNDCHEVEVRLRGYLRRGGANARRFVHNEMVLSEDPGND